MDLPDFSKIFHESSKDLAKGHPLIPADSKEWPREWKTTYYKAYSRLPKWLLSWEENTSACYFHIEAGHIGQNIYLVSEALGIKCCALGGTRDENLEKLIDIDGVTESVVYGFAVGK